MAVGRISTDHTLDIPDEFRDLFPPGQEVAIATDPQGRLVITPVEQLRSRLLETFGMWGDRTDMAGDGVEYMDAVRRGERLNAAKARGDETD